MVTSLVTIRYQLYLEFTDTYGICITYMANRARVLNINRSSINEQWFNGNLMLTYYGSMLIRNDHNMNNEIDDYERAMKLND